MGVLLHKCKACFCKGGIIMCMDASPYTEHVVSNIEFNDYFFRSINYFS